MRAARAARHAGARRVIALVTHGLFMAGAAEVLADPAIERLVVTDTVPAFRLPTGSVHDKLDILPAAPLLAETIRRLDERQRGSPTFSYSEASLESGGIALPQSPDRRGQDAAIYLACVD